MQLLTAAAEFARHTPATRNRAADFFRAAAIVMVVLGHWLVVTPYYVGGRLEASKILALQPWTQFLTWLFQVMPVFFMVGGYSNAASWLSACRNDETRRSWPGLRMKRLMVPILPLVIFWVAVAAIAHAAGLEQGLTQAATRGGLIPVWFLSVYALVTAVVPISYAAWARFGLGSVAVLVIAAALIDLIAFSLGADWLRWLNYGFIWLGVHQLGYWWHSGQIRARDPLYLLAIGIVCLILLVGFLGYPVSMVSVPGAEVSNSSPPTFAMIAMAFVEAGFMLLVAGAVSRWLTDPRPWTLVILISSRIMTLYLWHTTALVALVGLALMFDGYGLKSPPGSLGWWFTRPIWIAALAIAITPFMALFGGIEGAARYSRGRAPGPVTAFAGAVVACFGLALLALQGSSADNMLGVNIWPALFVLVGVVFGTASRRPS